MNEGYIILPRAIMDEEYFAQKFTRPQALIDLYMLAAYVERSFNIRGNKVVVKRGQVAVAEQKLADRWHWSRNTVHKFLSELQESGKVALQRSRLINIVSLNYYGIVEQQNEQQNEQPYINIINKEKQKENIKRNDSLEIPDYVAPSFVSVMADWMRYKSERGESYKPTGLRAAYTELIKLSGNDPAKAREIILKAMSNNYKGFNFQKDNNHGTENRQSPQDNINKAIREYKIDLAESFNKTAERDREVLGSIPNY